LQRRAPPGAFGADLSPQAVRKRGEVQIGQR